MNTQKPAAYRAKFNDINAIFDVRGFLIKLLRFWPIFIVSIGIAYSYAYYISVRKLPVYYMENSISIKDDPNPFFTTNTSLTFKWGGVTDKVNTALVTLRSRTHNEKVVDDLGFFVQVQKDGTYQRVDAYGSLPFQIDVDRAKPQLLNTVFTVEFLDENNYILSASWNADTYGRTQLYDDSKEIGSVKLMGDGIKQNGAIGESFEQNFAAFTLWPVKGKKGAKGQKYYITFLPFDQAVGGYLGVRVSSEFSGSSVIKLSMTGNNKARMVDYLNGSVAVLDRDMLERKNLYATKTIKFIDSSLASKSTELSLAEDQLNSFKNKNSIIDLEFEGETLRTELTQLDIREEALERELNYYAVLETYLATHDDYSDIPAPSVIGISEGSVVTGVTQIIEKALERSTLEYSYQEGAPIFRDIDRQIDAIKRVLQENISSSKSLKNEEL
ncbi:MAG: sugar transporter, partial [Flavobacteriaceae bacterium]|nr:sugar transporter [Flavobacteriaceae bacterium]